MVLSQSPPSGEVQASIFDGEIVEGMTFNQRVWAACARIPKGRVATYADLARAVGAAAAFRAVGNAMNKNPYAPRVPCHRVVGSDGRLTGYAGGIDTKRRMLIEEGVRLIGEDRVDLSCRVESL
jgi:O-6-methylguanine DNA methyltransferase